MVFPLVYRQVTVSDAWWHAALGKWMVEQRSLPDLSQFYFSPIDSTGLSSELRWQWLGDILLYAAYAAGGAAGIQWLVLACALLGLGLLAKCGANPRGPWMLLLLTAVCLGTYQLQLARNSVFSLPLYAALLWMGSRKTTPPTLSEYAALLGLLGLWSCLHGSCALGWIAACALYAPRALAAFCAGADSDNPPTKNKKTSGTTTRRASWKEGWRATGLFLAAMAAILIVICIGRRDALHFLGLPFRHITAAATGSISGFSGNTLPATRQPAPEKALQTPAPRAAPSRSLKEWLNSSIWKSDPAVPWSNDYWSPLDMLPRMRPIEAAYTLAAVAAVSAVVFRNVPAGLLLAWLGAVFLGLGYVRMFGYTALASGAVILASTRHLPRKPALQAAGWILAAIWTATVWGLFFTGKIDAFIPDGQHVSHHGQAPIYDDAVADWVRREYPQERVFTTIETGSHCLLRWDFKKQVFLDGFFAPHTPEVWNAYHAAMRRGDLRPLEEKFGIRLAILPTTSPRWIDVFLRAKNWTPIALGNGAVVFAHRSVNLSGKSPALLASAPALQKTTYYYREAALRSLLKIIAAASPEKGYRADQWTAQPAFETLRKMAARVFPKK